LRHLVPRDPDTTGDVSGQIMDDVRKSLGEMSVLLRELTGATKDEWKEYKKSKYSSNVG